MIWRSGVAGWGGDGPCKNSIAPSTGRRLKEDLLCNYDRDARPVKNSTNGTTVLMNMFPMVFDLVGRGIQQNGGSYMAAIGKYFIQEIHVHVSRKSIF
uniref:Uncharacterized protein n=1 Tax=Rhodnius prolixus TaxID=13249 RepID=T1HT82_RHOPR